MAISGVTFTLIDFFAMTLPDFVLTTSTDHDLPVFFGVRIPFFDTFTTLGLEDSHLIL